MGQGCATAVTATPWWVGVPIVVSWLAAGAFVAGYARRPVWRNTVMGRHMMTFMTVVWAVLSFSLVTLAVGDYPGRQYVRGGYWTAIAAVLCWRVALLYRAQRGADLARPDRAG